MQTTCQICIAVDDSQKQVRQLYNTPLKESDNFIIIPCRGPLVDGHALITSKAHYMNLFSMPEEFMGEFNLLVGFSIQKLGNNVLFVEHGSYDDQTGGSCVSHTHVHVIPSMEDCYNVLDATLKSFRSDFKTMDLKNDKSVDYPYILTFNVKNQSRLYQAYNAHTQMMRKAICQNRKRDDWNWRLNDKLDIVKKTIDLWTL